MGIIGEIKSNKLLSFSLVVMVSFFTILADRVIFVHGDNLIDNCTTNYRYINPFPDCEIYQEKTERYDSLQGLLNNKVKTLEESGVASRIAVFTRDLNSRRFAGVKENERFYMASLLKVPLSIAWYKLAEVEPKILEQQYRFEKKDDLYSLQNIQPELKLEVGNQYTIRNLIESALIFSDNSASQILFQELQPGFIDRIMQALSLQFEIEPGIYENIITARSYANIFRVLYNSSYLTRDYSDVILKDLVNSKFTDGARSVLPNDVLIASKFGERVMVSGDIKTYQLHECGIVYADYGKQPYTFCILTEGNNIDELKTVIQELSKVIFESVT